MARSQRYLAVITVLFSLLLPQAAQALTCYPTTIPKMFAKAEYVIAGKVIEVDGRDILFERSATWKGVEASHFAALQGKGPSNFIPGDEYLVFSYLNPLDDELYAEPYGCTLTRHLEDAKPFIDALNFHKKHGRWADNVRTKR